MLDIKKGLALKPAEERFNSEYLKALEAKKELISSVNYIGCAADTLSRDIAEIKEEAGRAYAVMADSIGSIFRFALSFNPDVEVFNEGDLSDFSDYTSEAEIKAAVSDYFAGKDSDVRFSNDTLKWAEAVLSDTGSDILKKFGIAFYAEFKNKVTVPIYSDQNYIQLKKGKYADCSPENYTDNAARNILAEIKSDPEVFRLYAFFRAMHLTGYTSLDYSFMGKDISKIAHDYLWRKSKDEESHIKKKHWWSNFWKRTAKKMSKMRHNMTDVNGNSERGTIWGDMEKAFSARESFLSKKDEIRILTGGEEGECVSFDDFIVSINEVSGKLPDEAGSGFEELLRRSMILFRKRINPQVIILL